MYTRAPGRHLDGSNWSALAAQDLWEPYRAWRGLFGARASHAQKECVWRSMGGTRMTRAELLRRASHSRSAKRSPAAQFITAKHT